MARPPTLGDLQQALAARILPPEQRGRLAAAGVALEEWLHLPAEVNASERVAVYADGFPARLREALAEAYPAVEHVVGPDAFGALAHGYARFAFLSSYNLNDAGGLFPEFLSRDPLTGRLPFLPDLARLEWSVTRAFHSAAEPPLDAAALAGWSMETWARGVLRFQPAVAVVRSAWPIVDVWRHRETAPEEIDIDLRDRPQQALVSRPGFGVRCEEIDAVEAEILSQLLRGRRLGEIALPHAECGSAVDVSDLFAGWMRAGLIVDCRVD
jgi:hypothetical protein